MTQLELGVEIFTKVLAGNSDIQEFMSNMDNQELMMSHNIQVKKTVKRQKTEKKQKTLKHLTENYLS